MLNYIVLLGICNGKTYFLFSVFVNHIRFLKHLNPVDICEKTDFDYKGTVLFIPHNLLGA